MTRGFANLQTAKAWIINKFETLGKSEDNLEIGIFGKTNKSNILEIAFSIDFAGDISFIDDFCKSNSEDFRLERILKYEFENGVIENTPFFRLIIHTKIIFKE